MCTASRGCTTSPRSTSIPSSRRSTTTFSASRRRPAFFRDPRVLEYVKARQKQYFIRLTQGDYEEEYVEDRLKLGSIHEQIGLPVRSFLGMYAFYLRQIAARLLDRVRRPAGAGVRGVPLADEAALLRHRPRGRHLHLPARAHHREPAGGDPRALDARAPGPRATADPPDHRDPRHAPGAASSPSSCSRASGRTARGSSSSTSRACRRSTPTVANHLVQTVEASRLMGAKVIVTGLSLGDRPDARDDRRRPDSR